MGTNLHVHKQSTGIQARPVYLMDGAYKRRYEYEATGAPLYIGETDDPTATTAQAKWRIKKYTNNGNGQATAENLADQSNDFNKVWDDRATYTYS